MWLEVVLFVVGYLAIVLEHRIAVNKSATALLTGVACWTAHVLREEPAAVVQRLGHHVGDIAQILFFLLGAMTIVELVDAHDGFELVTSRIRTTQKRVLLVVVAGLSFFLSAVLDNLTTAIVMMSLVRKLVVDGEDRLRYGGIVIIAANAGGAWSPIGDVTTTMLWVGERITAGRVITTVFVPSLVSVVVPTVWLALRMRGRLPSAARMLAPSRSTSARERAVVLAVGVAALLFVPVFKILTGLPPLMGMLLALGVLWLVTEVVHKRKNDEERSSLGVAGALQRIDVPTAIFFLGILLAIGALESDGALSVLARRLDRSLGSPSLVTIAIGIASSVVDNVPLVAAAQGMYDGSAYPRDHHFWLFLSYCAGTGGSILVIGSAAGVAVMGLERTVTFGAYLRRLSLPALAGYAAGAATYLLVNRS